MSPLSTSSSLLYSSFFFVQPILDVSEYTALLRGSSVHASRLDSVLGIAGKAGLRHIDIKINDLGVS